MRPSKVRRRAPDFLLTVRSLCRWGLGAALSGGLVAALVVGCSGAPPKVFQEPDGPPPIAIDVSTIPDAVPRDEPMSRYGNPASYEVDGRHYQTLASAEAK